MPKTYFDEVAQDYKSDHLYFIEDATAGAIKIGRGNDAVSRLRSCQTGNPNKLELIDAIPNLGWQEAFWHCAWQLDHILGEWFQDTPELRAAMAAARSGEDWTDHVPPLVLLESGEVPELGEWQEHMLDAMDAYADVALDEAPIMALARAAQWAIFDPDFDGRCLMTRFIEAGGGRVVAPIAGE